MRNTIIQGDCLEVLKTLPSESVDCCITSPPYWGLRDYGSEGQLGLEPTPEEYVAKLVEIFREIRRVLKKHGTLWLNLGDSYATTKVGNTETKKNPTRVTNSFKKIRPNNLKQKDLVGIPWRVAFALQADGWYLRQDIIWAKPNPMPESVTDRCTKSHEYVFLLSKSAHYYFDNEAIKEPQAEASFSRYQRGVSAENKWVEGAGGQSPHTLSQARPNDKSRECSTQRNRRSVWTITTKPFTEAHFATYPEELIEPMILAGTSEKGVCKQCGNSFKRIVKTETITDGGKSYLGRYRQIKGQPSQEKRGIKVYTLGWQATCSCGKEPIKAIVLDPFMGSGTTGAVAKSLNRDYLGIELNPAYIKIAERRILSQGNKELMSILKDVQDGKQRTLTE